MLHERTEDNHGKTDGNKKKVLIDLTNYGSIAVGFGQIAVNYAVSFCFFAYR